MNKVENNRVHFWYKIDELFNDIYGRTSYLGARRKKDTGESLIDEISFSEDEAKTLYKSYLQNAQSEVYDDLTKYVMRTVVDATTYEYDRDTDINGVADSEGSVYYMFEMLSADLRLVGAVDTAIREALINYVIWKWLEIAYPNEAQIYANGYLASMSKVRERFAKMDIAGSNGVVGDIIKHWL